MAKKKKWGRKKISETINDLESAKNTADEILAQLRQKASEISTKAGETNQSAASVAASEQDAKNTIANLEEIKGEISELRDGASELKRTTEELVEANKSIAKESKDQLGIIAGGSLSNTFEKRRGTLETSARFWFWLLMGNILILSGVALVVFLELKSSQSLTTNFFLKFSLAFPFIYAAYFFQKQYFTEKDLEEEYAFKSAVSLSLNAYRKLLNSEIDHEDKDERREKLDFITNTINGLYAPPRRSYLKHGRRDSESGILKEIKDIIENVVGLVK